MTCYLFPSGSVQFIYLTGAQTNHSSVPYYLSLGPECVWCVCVKEYECVAEAVWGMFPFSSGG